MDITWRTAERLVANVDGDFCADGDDRVKPIFGGGTRFAFPERDAYGVAVLDVDESGVVYADHARQGYIVTRSRFIGL